MDFTPTSVSIFLFNGIQSAIERLLKIPIKDWEDYEVTQFTRIKNAVEWYKEYCVISSTLLEIEYEKIVQMIGDKFIYDGDKYLRYTFRSRPIGNKLVEHKNQLISREILPYKNIEIDKIVVGFNNEPMKIVEVFENPDREYGYFIAESLSIEEIIAWKGGLGKK
jgi:hypothetical protein